MNGGGDGRRAYRRRRIEDERVLQGCEQSTTLTGVTVSTYPLALNILLVISW